MLRRLVEHEDRRAPGKDEREKGDKDDPGEGRERDGVGAFRLRPERVQS